MSAAQGPDRGPDDRTRVHHRTPPPADRARGAAGRVGVTWRELNQPQRLAAVAALALLVSMLLPWYRETGTILVDRRPVPLDESKNAFAVYSFVEAAIFVVAIGTLALLWARGQRKAFHLPGGDGTVLLAAGLWVMFLVFYRQFDRPDRPDPPVISPGVSVDWGIFIAFVLGAVLAYAGYRLRAAHNPEPPVDDAPAAPSDVGPEPAAPPPPAPPAPRRAEPPTERAATPTERVERRDEIADGQLSFDEPAEYRPPPPRR
jgi:hypothetical protein